MSECSLLCVEASDGGYTLVIEVLILFLVYLKCSLFGKRQISQVITCINTTYVDHCDRAVLGAKYLRTFRH